MVGKYICGRRDLSTITVKNITQTQTDQHTARDFNEEGKRNLLPNLLKKFDMDLIYIRILTKLLEVF